VAQALPFGLKMYESLLAESPRHRGLLLAASKGFTSYAYAFVQQDADELEDHRSCQVNGAARPGAAPVFAGAGLLLSRGLESKRRDFGKALGADPKAAVRMTSKADVPLPLLDVRRPGAWQFHFPRTIPI